MGKNIPEVFVKGRAQAVLKAIKKWWKAAAAGLAAGILNGLFGSGGGMAALPVLKKSGLSVKEAHATSVLMMSVLTVLSAYLYLSTGRLVLGEAARFIPGGIAGGVLGALLFTKIKANALRKIFGGFVIFAAVKMLLGQAAK